jgi:hypothetical protein
VDLKNLTQKWVYDLGMHGEISTLDQIESPPSIPKFPILALRGRKGSKEGALFMESFALGEENSSYGDEISCMRFLGGGR